MFWNHIEYWRKKESEFFFFSSGNMHLQR